MEQPATANPLHSNLDQPNGDDRGQEAGRVDREACSGTEAGDEQAAGGRPDDRAHCLQHAQAGIGRLTRRERHNQRLERSHRRLEKRTGKGRERGQHTQQRQRVPVGAEHDRHSTDRHDTREVGADHQLLRLDPVGPNTSKQGTEKSRDDARRQHKPELARSAAVQDDGHRERDRLEAITQPRQGLASRE